MAIPQIPLTTEEVVHIRESKSLTPTTMAKILGVNLQTYYLWERGRKVSMLASLALLFIQSQEIPPESFLPAKTFRRFKARFLRGKRFGRLVVVGAAPPTGSSRHINVTVQCDCGVQKPLRAAALTATSQCGKYCTHRDLPFPPQVDAIPTTTPQVRPPTPKKAKAGPVTFTQEELDRIRRLDEEAALLDATPAEINALHIAELRAAAPSPSPPSPSPSPSDRVRVPAPEFILPSPERQAELDRAFEELDGDDDDLDSILLDTSDEFDPDVDPHANDEEVVKAALEKSRRLRKEDLEAGL